MDVSYLLVRLRPTAPFHLGRRGIGLEATETFVHSDTLFSALCHVWVRCFGQADLENRFLPLAQAKGRGSGFRISSAFPYAYYTLFFPRPFAPVLVDGMHDPKAMKRCRFVSSALFEDLIQGRKLAGVSALQERAFWISEDEKQSLSDSVKQTTGKSFVPDAFRVWAEDEVPRVSLDRVTQASNIFYFSRVTFLDGCGLFFLADLDAALQWDFQTAVRVLGDTGIGGDRTAGYGQFVPEFSELKLCVPDDASHAVTLSLLSPENARVLTDMIDEHCAYDLVLRDGWIDSPDGRNYRRRACQMFAEGSVFRLPPSGTMGRLVEVTPTAPKVRLTHPVYRYGIGFPVPMCTQEEGV